nr:class I SAM-dependent methyltransferase [Burkholderia pseudomallei]
MLCARVCTCYQNEIRRAFCAEFVRFRKCAAASIRQPHQRSRRHRTRPDIDDSATCIAQAAALPDRGGAMRERGAPAGHRGEHAARSCFARGRRAPPARKAASESWTIGGASRPGRPGRPGRCAENPRRAPLARRRVPHERYAPSTTDACAPPPMTPQPQEEIERTMSRYTLGHSPIELRRLDFQSEMLKPVTRRLLESARLRPSMRVLDIGCGTGGVSMLAAEMVGPAGTVVAIDPSEVAIEAARANAERARLHNIRFRACGLDQVEGAHGFDVVVFRCVVIHQLHAVEFVRHAARFVKPGGYLALHEPDFVRKPMSTPAIPLWDSVTAEILERCKRSFPSFDVAHRMVKLFAAAGLPLPKMAYEVPVDGGTATKLSSWLAEMLRALSSDPDSTVLGNGKRIEFGRLSGDLQCEIHEARAQVEFFGQLCACAQL